MKRFIIGLLTLLLFTSLVACQDNSNKSGNTDENYDLWGDLFSHDLVSFQSNENYKWGFFNTSGEIVVEPTYNDVTEFSDNGFAVVSTGSYEYNFINTEGVEQLNTDFSYIEPFVGHSTVYRGSNGYGILLDSVEIEAEGRYEILKNSNYPDRFLGIYLREWHLIDDSGEVITETGYDSIYPFKDEASVTVVEKDRAYGVINSEGEEVIPAIYDEICINEVNSSISVMQDDLYGLFDKNGNQLLEVIYRYEHIIYKGYNQLTAPFFTEENLAGFIDLDGDIIINPTNHYNRADDYGVFGYGYQLLQGTDSKNYIYNQKGKEMYEVDTTSIIRCNDKVYVVRDSENDKYLAYNYKGTLLFETEDELYLSQGAADYFIENIDGHYETYNLYNYDGEKVLSDAELKGLFINGMLCFKDQETGKWGYMNNDLEVVIEPTLDMNSVYGYFFKDGYTLVRYRGINVIDSEGNILLEEGAKQIKSYRLNQ